jgi:hypothetical protein
MSANEVEVSLQRYQVRLTAILTPDELALYEGYRQRVQAGIDQGETAPVRPSPEECAVIDKIEADTEAQALNKQLFALIRVDHLPQ